MNIAPFWVRIVRNGVTATGWSFVSREDAVQRAHANAQQISDRLAGAGFNERGKLYYPDRPMREPIMREFRDREENVIGLVTRNAYGSLVLNASRALFVDVDLTPPPPPKPQGLIGLLSSFLGSKPAEPPPVETEATVIAKAEAWARAHSPWEWRIYRTKAGLRLLATHAPFEASAPIVPQVFEALGADVLYRKLCTSQKCFRARLTPKAWRCEYIAPTIRWPFVSPEAESRYQEWETGYMERCKEWSTCELITSTGSEPVHEELAELVVFHDAATRVGSGLPLA